MRRMRPYIFALGVLAVVLLIAQAANDPGEALHLTATSANVSGAPDAVRIEILRWSTDDEREALMSAWELKPAAANGPGAAKGTGKAGRSGGKGAPGARGRGGAAVGAAAASAEGPTPESSLVKAIEGAPTVGYLWSSEAAGYALRYAGKFPSPDGSQRIVLITERKLGAVNQLWNPTFQGVSNSYDFSVVELRLNARGEGEGKISLIGKVAPDPAAKIVALENYDSLPVTLRGVRKQAAKL